MSDIPTTPTRAQAALEAALRQRTEAATEPNLIDAAEAEALPVPEVLIALDRLGSGAVRSWGEGVPAWYQQAARQAAAMIRAHATDRVQAQAELEKLLTTAARVRRTDPQTSHDAAALAQPRAGSQAAKLLLEYAEHDGHRVGDGWGSGPCRWGYGMTSEEAAELAEGVSFRSEYAKRVSDLATLGLVEPVTQAEEATTVVDGATVPTTYHAPVTRPGRSGRQRQVYRITDTGRALAVKLREAAPAGPSAVTAWRESLVPAGTHRQA